MANTRKRTEDDQQTEQEPRFAPDGIDAPTPRRFDRGYVKLVKEQTGPAPGGERKFPGANAHSGVPCQTRNHASPAGPGCPPHAAVDRGFVYRSVCPRNGTLAKVSDSIRRRHFW